MRSGCDCRRGEAGAEASGQDSRLPLTLQRAAKDGRCKRPAQALRIDRDH